MAKENQNFTMYAGETRDIIVTVTDEGTAANLEGAKVRWALKRRALDASRLVYKTTEDGITKTQSTFTVRLDEADTESLPAGRYYHAAEVEDLAGNVSTVLLGYVVIRASGV